MPEYQSDLFGERLPSVRTPTSQAAADSMKGSPSENARRLVLACIYKLGPMTDEEVAHALGMNPSTARPRRIELERAGLVFRVGTKKTKSGRKAVTFRAARETLVERKPKSDKPSWLRRQKDHA